MTALAWLVVTWKERVGWGRPTHGEALRSFPASTTMPSSSEGPVWSGEVCLPPLPALVMWTVPGEPLPMSMGGPRAHPHVAAAAVFPEMASFFEEQGHCAARAGGMEQVLDRAEVSPERCCRRKDSVPS